MKQQFLVVYDYGQGGVWAIVAADDREAISARFPEVQVVDERPAWMTDEEFDRLRANVVDIDVPSGLLADILKARTSAP